MTAVFPELFSGNTPIGEFFRPPILLLFIVAYGLPILVIREWAVRRGTGWFGIFVMGLGYGLVNEGVFARTIFRETGVPIDTFDHYSYAFGVNWGWAAFIATWHAVASVLLPIALSERLFPARGAWIDSRGLAVLAGAVLVTGSAFFLVIGQTVAEADLGAVENDLAVLLALWAVILGLCWLGSRITRQGQGGTARLWPFLLGLSGVAGFIAAAIPSDQGWPVPTTFLILGVLIALYTAAFRWGRIGAPIPLGWFAFGWYLQVAALSWTAIAATAPLTVLADILLLGVVFAVARQGIPYPAARNT